MSAAELVKVINLVKYAKPKNVVDVQVTVERYFNSIGWSLLKEEYEVSMTEQERIEFITKLFTEVRALNST